MRLTTVELVRASILTAQHFEETDDLLLSIGAHMLCFHVDKGLDVKYLGHSCDLQSALRKSFAHLNRHQDLTDWNRFT